METCSESKVHLSSDIVASTAAFLTQKQWWGALEALLRRHALPALAQCPGLVLALVQAGRFSVLPGMLYKVNHSAVFSQFCWISFAESETQPACTAGWLVCNSELLFLQAKDLPRAELIPILQLLLSPATPAMEGHCKQHHHWLRKQAVTAVESAESACLAHITTEGELTNADDALQEKVVKAAYAAAAVDHMTAQVLSPYHILSLGVVTGALLLL